MYTIYLQHNMFEHVYLVCEMKYLRMSTLSSRKVSEQQLCIF